MEFNKIISITGKSGLFELMSTRADGAVVRSLEDNSTKFAASRQHQFSHLESIEVYTQKDNTTLREILIAMKNSDEPQPDANAEAKVLKAYFEKVYPEMDFGRVFNSDMKKMVRWYKILTEKNIDFTKVEKDEAGDDVKEKPAAGKYVETPRTKEVKAQQTNPRKVEHRGVQ